MPAMEVPEGWRSMGAGISVNSEGNKGQGRPSFPFESLAA